MIRIDLAYQAEYSLQALSSLRSGITPDQDREEALRNFEELCLHLHTLAAASLLVEGDPQVFFKELRRAAQEWHRLLRHQRDHGGRPPPASRNRPLLGAVLAGDSELARAVASLSATGWQEGEEYEDDACWAILLQELVLARADGRSCIDSLLARLDELGEEQNESRCAWTRSLLASDRSALADSFARLHLLHAEEIERQARSMTASEVRLAPYRYLWFEGLALLRLEERAGVPVRKESYTYCPPLARIPMDWTAG